MINHGQYRSLDQDGKQPLDSSGSLGFVYLVTAKIGENRWKSYKCMWLNGSHWRLEKTPALALASSCTNVTDESVSWWNAVQQRENSLRLGKNPLKGCSQGLSSPEEKRTYHTRNWKKKQSVTIFGMQNDAKTTTRRTATTSAQHESNMKPITNLQLWPRHGGPFPFANMSRIDLGVRSPWHPRESTWASESSEDSLSVMANFTTTAGSRLQQHVGTARVAHEFTSSWSGVMPG